MPHSGRTPVGARVGGVWVGFSTVVQLHTSTVVHLDLADFDTVSGGFSSFFESIRSESGQEGSTHIANRPGPLEKCRKPGWSPLGPSPARFWPISGGLGHLFLRQ